MDEFFNPSNKGGLPTEPEATEHLDPFLAERAETRPWEIRSAQYRAWSIAEMAFGPGVRSSLVGRPGYPSFRGLLHLTVPFRDLDDHHARQSLFLAWVGNDPVLARVPLVYVFAPEPASIP
jgi:hypothetical protein